MNKPLICPWCKSELKPMDEGRNQLCTNPKCHGFFGTDDVIAFWAAPKVKAPEKWQRWAKGNPYVTRKPSLIHDKNSQYAWRCPICFGKFWTRKEGQENLDACWGKVKDFRREHGMRLTITKKFVDKQFPEFKSEEVKR